MQNRSRNWDGRKSKLEFGLLGLIHSKSRDFDNSLMSMSAKVAKADGYVCKNEISTITKLVSEEIEHTTNLKKELFEVFNESKNSDFHFENYARNFDIKFKNSPELKYDVVDFLLELSYSDHKFCISEEKLIHSAVKVFDLEHKIFRLIQKQHHLKLENKNVRPISSQRPIYNNKNDHFESVQVFPEEIRQLYRLVDSNPADSLETIRLNYQAIAHRARPSQLSINAAPNEKILKAQEKYALATQAYKQILRERGQ